ncbi:hypothetical protein M9H77_34491 [Catharanthus roseus]|uniref:Uncharacterized protein n=1 Tax=Catharanthus roseus TaxID=4058 RepID=A0ACB9ZLD5_CATRO|nr:hypothetical protein M9H77_34491 [Catharanthus roseus]
MVAESWIRGLWKTSKRHDAGLEKATLGVLAFEVASLMSKLVHLWHSLSDKQVAKLREEIMSSLGIKKLVSDDDEYIVKLTCMEMMENLAHVARAVCRLSKKCSDPFLKSFEQAFNDMSKIGADPYGWLFTLKKMDRKAKKMERFIITTANLYHEMEALGDLEQTLRRMKSHDDTDSISLVEYEKKVAWKLQEVKHLKQISIWSRTYDYTILLLARSLFTIFSRIGHVFGISYVADLGVKESKVLDTDYIHRSRSVAFTQSSVHPSESNITRFSSGPLVRLSTQSGPILRTNNNSNFYSGPLGNSLKTSGLGSGKHDTFYSGPLGTSTTKSGPIAKAKKTGLRMWQSRIQSSLLPGKKSSNSKHNRLITSAPFNGCMMGGSGSPARNCRMNLNLEGGKDENVGLHAPSISSSKNRLLNAPPETLGAAALALHYANIIIVIEKLVTSPHLIGQDARVDLYNMLPASIREGLRAKLKPYTKSLTASVYDRVLASEWNEAMSGILEWLAPLAHNMIRWQSERSFEHQNLVSKTNMLLVQTLYFANQAKTEASIIELLVGLNYVWRYGRELNAKALMECTSGRTIEDYLD